MESAAVDILIQALSGPDAAKARESVAAGLQLGDLRDHSITFLVDTIAAASPEVTAALAPCLRPAHEGDALFGDLVTAYLARDNAPALAILLDAGAMGPDFVPPSYRQFSMLAIAAGGQSTACVDLLLAQGASAELCGEWGETALSEAANSLGPHSLALVQKIAGAAAPPLAPGDPRFVRALYAAATHGYAGNTEVVQWLLAAGADPNGKVPNGATAMSVAAAQNHDEVVRILLRAGADPDAAEHKSADQEALEAGAAQALAVLRAWREGKALEMEVPIPDPGTRPRM